MNRSRVLLPVLFIAGASVLVAAPAQAGGRPLTAELAESNEVHGGSRDEGATGSAVITLNQGQGEICFDLDLSLSAPPLAAHIHEAPAGVSGDIVVNFFANGVVTEGCVSVSEALVKEIRKDPANYYVNVHNSVAPAGAVRGQLTP